MWDFDRLDKKELTDEYTRQIINFLNKLSDEISPYKNLVAGTFNEHSIFRSLFRSPAFVVTRENTLFETISYILMLKQ